MTAEIEILHYGRQEVPGPQVFFQAGWREWYWLYLYVFLLRVDGTYMLLDCGMDDLAPLNKLCEADFGERGLLRLNDDASRVLDLLAERGIAPEDIDYIGITHLHADHVANALLFPRARFLVSAKGWRGFQEAKARHPAMFPDPGFPKQVIAFLEQVENERLILLPDGPTPVDGIGIKHIGGHTLDSAAFTVETDEGPVIYPGDTVYLQANLDRDRPPGSVMNLLEAFEAMAWIRESGALVLPAHDPGLLERFPTRRIGS